MFPIVLKTPAAGRVLAALALGTLPLCPALAQSPVKSSSKSSVGVPVAAPTKILARSVPDAVARAKKLNRLAPDARLSVYLCFHFADPQAAKDYADAVNDPNSLIYGQWLTPQEIGMRFGPNPEDYQAALQFIKDNGLAIIGTPIHGTAIRVSGTAAQMEKAFGVTLSEYQEAPADALKRSTETLNATPVKFFSPAQPIRLPAALAGKVSAVVGLNNYARPVPHLHKKRDTIVSGPFNMAQARAAYDLTPLYNNNLRGQGRTVGVSNFVGVKLTPNGPSFISANGLPVPAAGALSNVSIVTVGTPNTIENPEADLDFEMVLGMAPLANVIIYDNGPDSFGGNDLYGVLSQELSENKVDIVTESYGWNIDGSDADAYNAIHQMMSMAGITYLAASGDNGNIANSAYQYPDYEPEVLNIGGTILQYNDTTGQYLGEIGWGGSGGGFTNNTAPCNTTPAYQKGRGVPTTPAQRLTPDISSAAAGANSGVYYFYYGGGLNSGYDGTSFASPIMAGSLALVEQYLATRNALPANTAGKQRLGRLNDRIYGFNGRNDIFHDVTSGNNGFNATPYWDYVTGWGSLDLYNFAVALNAPLTVTVTPNAATLTPGQSVSLSAIVTGSVNTGYTWSIASGPGTITSAGVYTAPANVSSKQTVVVRATSVLNTAAPGNTNTAFQPNPVFGTATLTISVTRTISGTVALEGIADPGATVQPINPFTFVLSAGGTSAPITVTQKLGAGGAFSLTNIPAGVYNLSVKGNKWLRSTPQNVTVLSGNATGLSFALNGGDANNDNSVDATDFGIFVSAYNSAASVPGSGYDARADFNSDGIVDPTDFGIFVSNYNTTGG